MKRSVILVTQALGILIIPSVILFSCGAQFGGKISKNQKGRYTNSPNYKDGKFINKNELKVTPEITFSGFIKGFGSLFSSSKETKPKSDLLVQQVDSIDIIGLKDSTRIIWFGHSTFLLQIDSVNILIDPMFSEVPSPYSWVGSKRFSSTLPITIDELPNIHAVIISHDHYDHLDYKSIIKLKDKVQLFYSPLGVGTHLEKWGVEKDKIVELDWWEEITRDNITYRCTPSQHSSGRRLKTISGTLWSSWIIKSNRENIFFSGDGGYGEHFKAIGEKYGPFDFAMMECGQYNQQWPLLHMFPEETIKAAIDIKAKQVMPIHWGAFKLSSHKWYGPVERLVENAKKSYIPLIIPQIGEPIVLSPEIKYLNSYWWREY